MESFDETKNGKGEELAGSIKVCIHTSHSPDLCVQALLIFFSKTFVIYDTKFWLFCFLNHIYFNDSCRSVFPLFKWNEISNMHAVKIISLDENLIHEVLRVMENLDSLHFFLFYFISLKSFTLIFRFFLIYMYIKT